MRDPQGAGLRTLHLTDKGGKHLVSLWVRRASLPTWICGLQPSALPMALTAETEDTNQKYLEVALPGSLVSGSKGGVLPDSEIARACGACVQSEASPWEMPMVPGEHLLSCARSTPLGEPRPCTWPVHRKGPCALPTQHSVCGPGEGHWMGSTRILPGGHGESSLYRIYYIKHKGHCGQ